MVEWVSVADELPPDDFGDECGEYYLIWCDDFGCNIARFHDNKWWPSYTTVIVSSVSYWSEINKPIY